LYKIKVIVHSSKYKIVALAVAPPQRWFKYIKYIVALRPKKINYSIMSAQQIYLSSYFGAVACYRLLVIFLGSSLVA